MPMSEPENVNISPNAINSEWCISPIGGVTNPATNSKTPNTHRLTAKSNCTFFMIAFCFSFPRISRITTDNTDNKKDQCKSVLSVGMEKYNLTSHSRVPLCKC